jgi:2,4-dienoyl-CoA reductase (NADPH2)
LARRGHRVTLVEKSRRLGGRLVIGSKPPHKSEVINLIRYLEHELTILNVPIVDHVDFDALTEQFDGVILATGATEKEIAIEGMDQVPVSLSTRVLDDQAVLKDPVIIVGAGLVGCETAEYLQAKNFRVIIVELQSKPLPDMGASLRWPLLQRLKKAGIDIFTDSIIRKIDGGMAVIESNGKTMERPIGSLVLSVGFAVEDEIRCIVEKSGLPFCVIGDQKSPRRIKDAIREGHQAATSWMAEWE